MQSLGLQGIRRGKKWKTTTPAPAAERPVDLVKRQFNPLRPNALWVADFTYVATWPGGLRRLRHRRLRPSHPGLAGGDEHAHPVGTALEQAVWVRRREDVTTLSGLVHHTDAGPIHVDRVHRTPRRRRRHTLDRHRRRCIRQRLGRDGDRPVQVRVDQSAAAVEDGRSSRDRHPPLHRLVQQPTPLRGERRHPAGRTGAGLLPSIPALSLKPVPPNRVSGKAGAVQTSS